MALNNSTSQQIMDKYNEMRVALDEYLRANTESQEEYADKLSLGLVEITKAETAELAAQKEQQLSIAESFVNSVINLNESEADAIAKKYADMRTKAEEYYTDGLMSEQAFSDAITQINQAELDAITNLEAKRLDLRIQTLGNIRGFEDEFYYARITQIDAETDKLREAGLAEIEIEAWKQQQIAELEENVRIKKEESISEFEAFVIQSNENVMTSLENTMAHSLASLISGTSSALDVWRSLWANVAQSVIAEISKIIVKALFANTLLKGLGMIGNFLFPGGATTPVIAQSANLFGNSPIHNTPTTPNNVNNVMQLMRKIDSLIESIENNPPQIYTQLIEGVPLNNAVRRASVMANEL
jgi:hypothetical protein